MPPTQSQNWLLFAFLSAIFAALTAIFGKVGVKDIDSNLATVIRTLVVLVIAAAIVSVQRQWLPAGKIPHRALLFLLLSGAATGLSWLCYWRAMQLGQASNVAVIDKSSLLFVIILAAIFLPNEGLTWRTTIGGLLVTAGMLIITLAPPAPASVTAPSPQAPPASQVTQRQDAPPPPTSNRP